VLPTDIAEYRRTDVDVMTSTPPRLPPRHTGIDTDRQQRSRSPSTEAGNVSFPFPDGTPAWQPAIGRPTEPVPDEALAVEVAERLAEELFLNGQHIVVEVQHSVVILEGNVRSEYVRRRAHEIVWGTAGVFDVCNRLVV
jgi:hypothetical protein